MVTITTIVKPAERRLMKTFEHSVVLYLRVRILDRRELVNTTVDKQVEDMSIQDFLEQTGFGITHDHWDTESTSREMVNPGVYVIHAKQFHEKPIIVSNDEMVFPLRRTSVCEIDCAPDKEHYYYKDAKNKLESVGFSIQQRINEQIRYAMVMSDPNSALEMIAGNTFILPIERCLNISIFHVDNQISSPFTEEETPKSVEFKKYKVYKLLSPRNNPEEAIGESDPLQVVVTCNGKIVLCGDWDHNKIDVLVSGFMQGIKFIGQEPQLEIFNVVVDLNGFLNGENDSAWWDGLYEGQQYPPRIAPVYFQKEAN